MPEPGRPEGDQADGVRASGFYETLGGVRGLIDSALPATVFVLTRLVVDDGLRLPIILALATGVVVVVLRLVRGESQQQALSGFFGLGIAVLFARVTGKGEGFFLPGIVSTAAFGVAFVVSAVLGRPAVAYALTAYDQRYAVWPTVPALRRACLVATWIWAVTFFVRAGVAAAVYRMEGDNDGLLLIVVNGVKWPLIIGAVIATVALVRRAGPLPKPTEPAPTATRSAAE